MRKRQGRVFRSFLCRFPCRQFDAWGVVVVKVLQKLFFYGFWDGLLSFFGSLRNGCPDLRCLKNRIKLMDLWWSNESRFSVPDLLITWVRWAFHLGHTPFHEFPIAAVVRRASKFNSFDDVDTQKICCDWVIASLFGPKNYGFTVFHSDGNLHELLRFFWSRDWFSSVPSDLLGCS